MEELWANYSDQTAKVTPNCGLVREVFPQIPLISGLGLIILAGGFKYVYPDPWGR